MGAWTELEGLSAREVFESFREPFYALDREWRFVFVNPAAEEVLEASADELVGEVIWERFPGTVGSAFEEEYRAAVEQNGPVAFSTYYPALRRWFSVQASPHRGGLSVTFHDITELKSAQERASRLADTQSALRRVATEVAAEADPSEVCQLVAAESARLVEADSSWIVRFDGARYDVLARVPEGARGGPVPGDQLAILKGSELHRVRETSRPVAVGEGAGGRFAPLGLSAAILVPIVLAGRPWGALAVAWREPRPDVEQDVPSLTDLAELVSVAIANADARTQLSRRASSDALTGLANRATLHERLDVATSHAQRHGDPLTLALVDVDHFKAINDGYGHGIGDQVMRSVADVLRRSCRREDLAARVGGDEFALLLDGADGPTALLTAERIRHEVAAFSDPALPPVTLSIGVCEFERHNTPQDLERHADDALYWAKRHGRDAAWLYDREAMAELHPEERPSQLENVPVHRAFWPTVLDALSEQIAVVDEDGRIVAVNEAWRRVSGIDLGDEAAVRLGADYLAAHDAAAPAEPVAGEVAAALRELVDGPRDRYEVEYPSGDHWFALRANRLPGDGPHRVVVHREDVTERRHAQAARGHLQTITEAMADGLIAIDAGGRITDANPAAGELLRREPDELIGMDASRALYATPQPPDWGRQMIEGRGAVRAEDDAFVRSDASEVPVAWRAASVAARDGEEPSRVLVFRDNTPHKLQEERLRRDAEGAWWAAEISQALLEDRFVLLGQPIVDLHTGRTTDHELLIRMRDEHGELIGPERFLPPAEEHGLVSRIDAWVIAQAARHAAGGHAVHCNVSAQSMGDPLVLDAIQGALGIPAAEASLLTFELTETAWMKHKPRASQFAVTLHELGCRVALDDFGTGYNSFARVKQLQIDVLKIDQSFVRDLLHHPASESVVKAIVVLAHDLGALTVAEGIEDEPTMARLRDLGVSHGQGFALGAPAPYAPA